MLGYGCPSSLRPGYGQVTKKEGNNKYFGIEKLRINGPGWYIVSEDPIRGTKKITEERLFKAYVIEHLKELKLNRLFCNSFLPNQIMTLPDRRCQT